MRQAKSKAVTELVARHLTVEDPITRAEALNHQMAIYLSSTGRRRDVLDERLLVIDGMPPRGRRTTADVVAAGLKLGLGQSGMYRLLRKIDELGPVAGLLPGHGAEPRNGIVRDGFGSPVDQWIADRMRRDPAAKVADVLSMLHSKAAMLEPEERPVLPAQTALRRRIHHLRSSGAVGAALDELVGESILVAHCAMDMMIRPGTWVPSDEGTASGIFIIDERTSLVLGSAVYAEDGAEAGLHRAIRDVFRTLTPIADAGVEIARFPSRVRWIVPSGMIEAARRTVADAGRDHPDVAFTVVTGPAAGNGREVYRHLGELEPPFRLLPRVIPGGGSPVEDDNGRVAYACRTLPGYEVEGLDMADFALRFHLDRRNGQIVDPGGHRKPQGFSDLTDPPSRPRELQAGHELSRTLVALFVPTPTASEAGGPMRAE